MGKTQNHALAGGRGGLSKKPVDSYQNESILRERCKLPQNRFSIPNGNGPTRAAQNESFLCLLSFSKERRFRKGAGPKGAEGG
ncbi:hypothetical protein, partial [Pseudoflavonifractor phocaeensis]|uniref:hypothetical protein n=1 Tax=Pseudoflavonifractor phocaeensis TaxID=1870988 RepID=UPI00195AEBDD